MCHVSCIIVRHLLLSPKVNLFNLVSWFFGKLNMNVGISIVAPPNSDAWGFRQNRLGKRGNWVGVSSTDEYVDLNGTLNRLFI